MTTIQDRIIKDFREQFRVTSDGEIISKTLSPQNDLEQFLTQSIKLVEEETRKEIAQEFLNKSPAILKPSLRKGYFLAMLILKSITNKEIKK